MALLISANMYKADELHRVLSYTDLYNGIGVEVFPLFDKEEYEEELKYCIPQLEKVPVSFHGPYYKAEHSAPQGTEAYEKTMNMVAKTLEYSIKLNSRYFVFHHNNCRVTEDKKAEMIDVSCKNFRTVEEMYRSYNIPVVVENAGVIDRGNMLFNQEEFIKLCKSENYKVLIDIGHANANGWDLFYVMEELKEQIVAYHLHNNDGVHDSHLRIHNGIIDFDKFIKEALNITPSAELIIEYCMDVADDEEGIKKDIEEILSVIEGNK